MEEWTPSIHRLRIARLATKKAKDTQIRIKAAAFMAIFVLLNVYIFLLAILQSLDLLYQSILGTFVSIQQYIDAVTELVTRLSK